MISIWGVRHRRLDPAPGIDLIKQQLEGITSGDGDLHRLSRSSISAIKQLADCSNAGSKFGAVPPSDGGRTCSPMAPESVRAFQAQMADREQELRDVRRDAVNELIDQIAGTVLTHLNGMAARCSNDLTVRRKIDQVVLQVRRESAEACSKAPTEGAHSQARKTKSLARNNKTGCGCFR